MLLQLGLAMEAFLWGKHDRRLTEEVQTPT